MKRDFELIRKLLIFFVDKPSGEHVDLPDVGGDWSETEVKYHLVLLYQAGFLNCEPLKSGSSDRVIRVVPFDLTWDGHEFLAKIRNEGVWQKVQGVVTSKGGTLAFAVINQLATKFALHAAGL